MIKQWLNKHAYSIFAPSVLLLAGISLVVTLVTLQQERHLLEYRTQSLQREFDVLSSPEWQDLQPESHLPALDDAQLLYRLDGVASDHRLDIVSVLIGREVDQFQLHSYSVHIEIKGEYNSLRSFMESFCSDDPWPVQLHSWAMKPLVAMDNRLLLLQLHLQFWGEGREEEYETPHVWRDAQNVCSPFKAK